MKNILVATDFSGCAINAMNLGLALAEYFDATIHYLTTMDDNRKGKQIAPWDFGGMAPAAGLKTSMNDLLAFVNANLNPPNKKLKNAFAEVQQSKVDVIFGKGGRVTSMGSGRYTSTLAEESNLPVVWINGGTGGF